MPIEKNWVTVGLIQSQVSSDIKKNRKKTLENIISCAERGAQIICTQELFATLYFCQEEKTSHFMLAEPIPGPTTEAISTLANKLQVVVIASIFERRMAGIYHNTAAIIDADGSLLGIYRKMHIPNDPFYYEKFYFTPGDIGYQCWQTRYARIGVLICWDQWFPEAARITALKGADILFCPTAIGWQNTDDGKEGEKQHHAWELTQRSHATTNGIYVCSINRIGNEKNIRFWGQSFVCDPMGSILEKAGRNEEKNITCSFDLDLIEKTRQEWPFFRDRRIDSYNEILKLGL